MTSQATERVLPRKDAFLDGKTPAITLVGLDVELVPNERVPAGVQLEPAGDEA